MAIGTRHYDNSTGKEYVFVKASAAITQYFTVWIKSSFSAVHGTLALGASGGEFAVAPVAVTLDGYGWMQTMGTGIVKCIGGNAANASLYMSGTAGHIDDATLSVHVMGITLTSAAASSLAPFVMSRIIVNSHQVTDE